MKRGLVLFLGFFLAACAMSLPALLLSQVDCDTSIYLAVANNLLQGGGLYGDVWDHKPPGIYLLFALAQLAVGRHPAGTQVLVCLATALTCLLLYRSGEALDPQHGKKLGLLAGVFYLGVSPFFEGLVANTEPFFILFVVAAFHVVLRGYFVHAGLGKRELFGAGLWLGLAFQFKYVAVFDAIALGLALACMMAWREGRASWGLLGRWASRSWWLGIGILVPFLPIWAYFALTHRLDAYYYANFVANRLYLENSVPSPIRFAKIMRLLREHFAWVVGLGALTLAWLLSRVPDRAWRVRWVVLALWAGIDLAGVCLQLRNYYPHYFLQVLPALSLLMAAGTVALMVRWGERRLAWRPVLVTWLALAAVPGLQADAEFLRYRVLGHDPAWRDVPAVVTAYLRPRLQPGDYLFVEDADLLGVYYYLDAKAPTRYLLPEWLMQRSFSRFAGCDPVAEVQRIIAHRPAFIVTYYPHYRRTYDETRYYALMARFISEQYRLDRQFGNLHVYQRRSGPAPVAVGMAR